MPIFQGLAAWTVPRLGKKQAARVFEPGQALERWSLWGECAAKPPAKEI
jgi:hypothetical protein